MTSPTEEEVKVLKVSWNEIGALCCKMATHIRDYARPGLLHNASIIPVSRGGLIPATIMSHQLGIPIWKVIDLETIKTFYTYEGRNVLVIDDICDTGRTFTTIRRYLPNAYYVTPYVKPQGLPFRHMSEINVSQDTWVHFPWELPSKEWTRSDIDTSNTCEA